MKEYYRFIREDFNDEIKEDEFGKLYDDLYNKFNTPLIEYLEELEETDVSIEDYLEELCMNVVYYNQYIELVEFVSIMKDYEYRGN